MRLVLSRTPMRISICGGGSDFPYFYESYGGAVLSYSIDQYIYILVKDRFEDNIRVGYSRTENVEKVDDLQHDLAKECLKKFGIGRNIEVSSISDLPSNGTGLGASSSYCVGLLHALYHHQDIPCSPSHLAADACEIEIEKLKRPIGKQDQYGAAFGGLKHIEFSKKGVDVRYISPVGEIESHILLVYTNLGRDAGVLLEEQKQNLSNNIDNLKYLSSQARLLADKARQGRFEYFGKAMDEAWQAKKQLSSKISNPQIDEMYNRAKEAGAEGGKLAGAGAGGFLILWVPPRKQKNVMEELKEYKCIKPNVDLLGTTIVYEE
jgi:D-glycero-alpha-D-manno-heptose-7-phosphate kinase